MFFPESYAELPVHSLDGWLGASAMRCEPPPLKVAARRSPSSAAVPPTSSTWTTTSTPEMDAVLAETRDLSIDGEGFLVHGPTGRRIDVIYERVDEDRLYAEVPGLLEAHVEGRCTSSSLRTPRSWTTRVEAFVPEMVRTYLGEEPLIQNARTWSLSVEEDYRYVMDHFGELVVKSRGGYGGKEVMIGPEETEESVERFGRWWRRTLSSTWRRS